MWRPIEIDRELERAKAKNLEKSLDHSELDFEEVSVLINKTDDWCQIGPTNFVGHNKGLGINVDYGEGFILERKTAKVYVYTDKDRVGLGEITGEEGYKLYSAVLKRFYNKEEERRKSEIERIKKSLEIKAEILQKVREELQS